MQNAIPYQKRTLEPAQQIETCITLAQSLRSKEIEDKERHTHAYMLALQAIGLATIPLPSQKLIERVKQVFAKETNIGDWIIKKFKEFSNKQTLKEPAAVEAEVETVLANIGNNPDIIMKYSDDPQPVMVTNYPDTETIQSEFEEKKLLITEYEDINEQFKIIEGRETNLTNATSVIAKKYTSEAFKELMNIQMRLVSRQKAIDALYVKYKTEIDSNSDISAAAGKSAFTVTGGVGIEAARNLALFTVMPMKNVGKIPLLAKSLKKELDKLQAIRAEDKTVDSILASPDITAPSPDAVVIQSEIFAEALNQSQRMQALPTQAQTEYKSIPKERKSGAITYKTTQHDKEIYMMRRIIETDILATSQKNNPDFALPYSIYLMHALPLAAPAFFAEGTSNKFAPVSSEIASALGYNSNNGMLYPGQFNAEELDKRYNSTKPPHPIWLILKSLKPIGNDFSPEQKLDTYFKLADAYISKNLGEHDKAKEIDRIIKAAYALANQYPQYGEKVLLNFVTARSIVKKTPGNLRPKLIETLTLQHPIEGRAAIKTAEVIEADSSEEVDWLSTSSAPSRMILSLPMIPLQTI